MALNGTLILNGADYVPFNLYGVGVFMAFSGKGVYMNNAACGAIPDRGVKRGLFRLHPGRISEGCITLVHNADHALIRDALMQTTPMPVSCMKSLMARGWIEVIASGNNNTCP